MRRVLVFAAAAAILSAASLTALGACGGDTARAVVPELGDSAKAKAYKVTVGGLNTTVGKHGTFSLKIVPTSGYKVNAEYPTKVTFTNVPTKVELDKKVYKKTDAKIAKGTLTLAMGAKGKASGEETITAQAKFSICNATTCLLEKATVSIKVAVK